MHIGTENLLLDKTRLAALQEAVDIKHTCGYVTVANLDMYDVTDASGIVLTPSKADLLKEEVDSCTAATNNLSLELEMAKAEESKSEEKTNWVILDVSFGVPLFDPDLNKKVCHKIISNGLWKGGR